MREEIVQFVRGRLGCGCPEEVFRNLAWEDRGGEGELYRALGEADPLAPASVERIISAGGRLLVLIASVSEAGGLGRLLDAGTVMRDRLGFTRLRLACLGGKVLEGEKARLQRGRDDRVHLHFL